MTMRPTGSLSRSVILRRVVLRLAAGALALLALGGPSPGYIGGCSGVAPSAPDAHDYCIQKNGLVCVRDVMSGRITREQFDNICYPAITTRCGGASWGACVPNTAQTNACLTALNDASRFSTVDSEIVECNQATWCPDGI